MDISPLDIKLVRQQTQSQDCIRCCGLMVLRYFNDPIAKDELWKKLHVYQKHSGLYGSYLTDLGLLAIDKGYQAVFYSYDTAWWDASIIEAYSQGQKFLLKALKSLKKTKKSWHEQKAVQKEIDFAKAGGEIRVEFPQLETIDNYLLKRIPVILLVRAENLYLNPQEKTCHAVVVVGKQNHNYLIKDPYLDVKQVTANELLYAWMRQGGAMLVMLPTAKTQTVVLPKTVQQKLKW